MAQHISYWMALAACWFTAVGATAQSNRPTHQVVLGADSIILVVGEGTSEHGLSIKYLEDFFLARFPQATPRIVNSTVMGSQSADVLERLPAELSTIHPSHVAVGLNPFADGMALTEGEAEFQALRHELVEIDRLIRAADAIPIYLSPTIFDAQAALKSQRVLDSRGMDSANATSAYFGVRLQEFADEFGAGFIDLHAPLKQLTRMGRITDPQWTVMLDGWNPLPAGHLAIAVTLASQLGLEHSLSHIRLDLKPDECIVDVEGGVVTNLLSLNGQRVEFVWQAEALPWGVPAEAACVKEMLQFDDRFNREILEVSGLNVGIYELWIEERFIGRFSSEAFADGIELHRWATPQLEQARRLVEKNRERRELAIRPDRELWVLKQALRNLQRAIEKSPDRSELRAQLVELEQKLDDFEIQQAKLRNIAETMFAELSEESRPPARRFEIRPVKTAEVRGRVLIGGVPISGAAVELHGLMGLTAVGTTDAMGFFQLTARSPDGIEPGSAWLVVLAKMVLPKFVSLEQNGHRVMLRAGVNEIELHFEDPTPGQ